MRRILFGFAPCYTVCRNWHKHSKRGLPSTKRKRQLVVFRVASVRFTFMMKQLPTMLSDFLGNSFQAFLVSHFEIREDPSTRLSVLETRPFWFQDGGYKMADRGFHSSL